MGIVGSHLDITSLSDDDIKRTDASYRSIAKISTEQPPVIL